MPESRHHKRYKNQHAGKSGSTEVTLPSGRRLDALTRNKIAVEIERGRAVHLTKSVESLAEALDEGVARKARLVVDEWRMAEACDEMWRQGVGGEVTNFSNTNFIDVPERRMEPKLCRECGRRARTGNYCGYHGG